MKRMVDIGFDEHLKEGFVRDTSGIFQDFVGFHQEKNAKSEKIEFFQLKAVERGKWLLEKLGE